MPDLETVLDWLEGPIEWLEEAFEWVGMFANDIVLGLLIAVGLMVWIWKGRGDDAQPAR